MGQAIINKQIVTQIVACLPSQPSQPAQPAQPASLGTKEKLWQFRARLAGHSWRWTPTVGWVSMVLRTVHQVIYMAFQFSVLASASANSVGQHSLPFTGNGQTVRIIAANLDHRKIQQANQFGFVIAMGWDWIGSIWFGLAWFAADGHRDGDGAGSWELGAGRLGWGHRLGLEHYLSFYCCCFCFCCYCRVASDCYLFI